MNELNKINTGSFVINSNIGHFHFHKQLTSHCKTLVLLFQLKMCGKRFKFINSAITKHFSKELNL